MKFVGLDLAWGELAWTGTAVADESGQLLRVGRQRTDEDIVTALRSHLGGPVLVAIDAPLVVTNRTGRRPCETLVSTLFGRYDAGAHSSNLSLPSFRDGPRGARVAALMGLDVDADFPPQVPVRRAIRVYPHPGDRHPVRAEPDPPVQAEAGPLSGGPSDRDARPHDAHRVLGHRHPAPHRG